jgi:hypothetical protein
MRRVLGILPLVPCAILALAAPAAAADPPVPLSPGVESPPAGGSADTTPAVPADTTPAVPADSTPPVAVPADRTAPAAPALQSAKHTIAAASVPGNARLDTGSSQLSSSLGARTGRGTGGPDGARNLQATLGGVTRTAGSSGASEASGATPAPVSGSARAPAVPGSADVPSAGRNPDPSSGVRSLYPRGLLSPITSFTLSAGWAATTQPSTPHTARNPAPRDPGNGSSSLQGPAAPSGGFAFSVFAALLVALLFAAGPALSRRLRGPPACWRPAPFLSLLESPG